MTGRTQLLASVKAKHHTVVVFSFNLSPEHLCLPRPMPHLSVARLGASDGALGVTPWPAQCLPFHWVTGLILSVEDAGQLLAPWALDSSFGRPMAVIWVTHQPCLGLLGFCSDGSGSC